MSEVAEKPLDSQAPKTTVAAANQVVKKAVVKKADGKTTPGKKEAPKPTVTTAQNSVVKKVVLKKVDGKDGKTVKKEGPTTTKAPLPVKTDKKPAAKPTAQGADQKKTCP